MASCFFGKKARFPIDVAVLVLHILCGYAYMGGSQNYGPFLGTLNIRCRIIIIGIQKGTIILTTTHIYLC